MTDVIKLLPEGIANQIAAGEVVQRPASAVKELMENAIDAGATQVKLIIKDAGKTLIQVIDNGCGMSETDARMSFERHATSKIREAKDLFAIHTMGFRGEALASIAAVAQVELRTKRTMDELGTKVVIEDSTVKAHEPCQCTVGTNISIKNLFYNVPARRNFLKADPIELRHITEEFQRIAMAHPDVFFSMHNGNTEVFHLPEGNMRQRIVKIFGDAVNKKLVPVQQVTDIMSINGFVGKPEYHKKNRGEQMFFVNRRFIKSAYLQHAVQAAFEGLIPDGNFPFFVLFLEISPAHIDINVHPTKQEIKFDDEKLIYNYLKVAVRHGLGSHSMMPALDFDQEQAFNAPEDMPQRTLQSQQNYPPERVGNYVSGNHTGGSGGGSGSPSAPIGGDYQRQKNNADNWRKLYEGLDMYDPFAAENNGKIPAKNDSPAHNEDAPQPIILESRANKPTEGLDDETGSFTKEHKEPYQLHGQYIISPIKSGFLLVDQQAASERILYEHYLAALAKQSITTQNSLFPKTIELPVADAELLKVILPEINKLGFDITEFGGNSFVIHGVPAELSNVRDEQVLIEKMLYQYKENLEFDLGIQDNLARSLARNAALKRGKILTGEEMQDLIDKLFACQQPYNSPSGKSCLLTFDLESLQKMF